MLNQGWDYNSHFNLNSVPIYNSGCLVECYNFMPENGIRLNAIIEIRKKNYPGNSGNKQFNGGQPRKGQLYKTIIMNTLLPEFLLLSLPVIFQVKLGNKAANHEIKLPYWAVTLLSFLLLTFVNVINVDIAGTLEIVVFGIFTGILLIVFMVIQAYVFYMKGNSKTK